MLFLLNSAFFASISCWSSAWPTTYEPSHCQQALRGGRAQKEEDHALVTRVVSQINKLE
jgi:hypothetical protein